MTRPGSSSQLASGGSAITMVAIRRLVLLLVGVTLLLVGLSTVAAASPRIEVTPTSDLDPDGQAVTVRGSGFDTSKGIYVAFCVTPAAGQLPSPCGGGVDVDGSSGGSVWINDDPPPYGEGLTRSFEDGGSFSVTIQVDPMIGDVDCRRSSCAVVTRADHLRTSDRSQDAVVPVTFGERAEQAAPPADEDASDPPSSRTTDTSQASEASEDPDAAPADEASDGPAADEPVEEQAREETARRPASDHEVAGNVGGLLRGESDPPVEPAPADDQEEAAEHDDLAAGQDADDDGERTLAAAEARRPVGPLVAAGAAGLAVIAAGAWWWSRRRGTARVAPGATSLAEGRR